MRGTGIDTQHFHHVQMLGFGGSFEVGSISALKAAVDSQISTMSTSVGTHLASLLEVQISTMTEAKHLISLSQSILVQ